MNVCLKFKSKHRHMKISTVYFFLGEWHIFTWPSYKRNACNQNFVASVSSTTLTHFQSS